MLQTRSYSGEASSMFPPGREANHRLMDAIERGIAKALNRFLAPGGIALIRLHQLGEQVHLQRLFLPPGGGRLRLLLAKEVARAL